MEYRTEKLDISAYDISDALAMADAVNRKFSKQDIYMEVIDKTLFVSVNTLDVIGYGNFLRELELPEGLKDAAFDIINRIGSYGLKGGKRIFVNYNGERKVSDRRKKSEDRNKYYYAYGNNFSKINNPLPDGYRNKILCADSLELLKNLPDNCIDLIFTSPPYNFGLEYSVHEDTSRWEEYYDVLFKIFRECIRVLKYGGRFVVNIQPLYSDYIPAHHIIGNFFVQNKMIWKGEIIWEKNNYNCKYCSWGSWKSPASPYLKYTWEFVEVYCKGDLKKIGDSADIDITDEEFKDWVVAKWSVAPERRMKDYGHPAMFPENLAERVLKLFSYKGDIIMDPFNGAGTTTVVAEKLKRQYLGIDVSPEYCKIAEQRIIDNRNKQQSVFLNKK